MSPLIAKEPIMGYVAIQQDGKTEVHAKNVNENYATLCGMDGNDSKVGQRTVPLDIGARIDCPHCIAIIRHAKGYREKDFDIAVRGAMRTGVAPPRVRLRAKTLHPSSENHMTDHVTTGDVAARAAAARFLNRSAAAEYVRAKFGLRCSKQTLAKLAVEGGGPIYQVGLRTAIYTPENLDLWALSKIGPPRASTSGPEFSA
jgi:hypothetical protein